MTGRILASQLLPTRRKCHRQENVIPLWNSCWMVSELPEQVQPAAFQHKPDQKMHGSIFFLRETRLPCPSVPFGKAVSVLLQFLVGTVTVGGEMYH